ncbi:unnamed protein product [Fraxinus pennsylvanica]|uniref:Uncharacterized protein n=1 Tax=Fraxinus pennsylvanica TaxID=56036 RepID=A0AAD2DR71_9LAMI|nr:unnamed protein product [Fraxinus pennsylvanica]
MDPLNPNPDIMLKDESTKIFPKKVANHYSVRSNRLLQKVARWEREHKCTAVSIKHDSRRFLIWETLLFTTSCAFPSPTVVVSLVSTTFAASPNTSLPVHIGARVSCWLKGFSSSDHHQTQLNL